MVQPREKRLHLSNNRKLPHHQRNVEFMEPQQPMGKWPNGETWPKGEMAQMVKCVIVLLQLGSAQLGSAKHGLTKTG